MAVAAILVVGVPAVLAALAAAVTLVSDGAGWALHLALVAILTALILSQVLYPLGLRLEVQAPLVLVAGAAAAGTYARLDGARSIVSPLGALPAVIVAYVFLLTPLSSLVFAGEPELEEVPQPEAVDPVVVVVFDELPGHALMDARGRIDAERFPSFGELAEDSTWYPNATTSRGDTELAVPTVMTGSDAPLDSLPTADDHPRSLFTLLGSSYEMHVSEPWTNLCPDELCEGATESTQEGGLGSLLETLPELLGHISVPDAQRVGIPSPRESAAVSRPGQFETFTEEVESSSEPVLHFLHILLPHKAWRYLPSGDLYADKVGADGELAGLKEWKDDEWYVRQQEQRFLLQLQFTDRLLGGLFAKLRDEGLYERSLIVVTADHGVSFRAGDERRDATDSNAADILSVPLFVKLPRQRSGRIDETPAQTVDVVPTIADAIGAELPWEVDGLSLVGDEIPNRAIAIENLRGGEVELTTDEYRVALDAALERRLRFFGDGRTSLYDVGSNPELHGERVEPLLGEPADAEASVVDGRPIRRYEPGSGVVPARIAGSLDGVDPGEPLALALHGRVAATTFAYEGDYRTEFAAMIDPRELTPGDNELEIFAIDGEAEATTLHPLEISY